MKFHFKHGGLWGVISFVALPFSFHESHATLVLGGWGAPSLVFQVLMILMHQKMKRGMLTSLRRKNGTI